MQTQPRTKYREKVLGVQENSKTKKNFRFRTIAAKLKGRPDVFRSSKQKVSNANLESI